MDQRQDRPVGRLKQIVIDCATPSALARFWAAALDDFEVRPYDDDEVARLAALGYTPETDPGVIVDGPHVEPRADGSPPVQRQLAREVERDAALNWLWCSVGSGAAGSWRG
jgi:hypothetical protein